MPLALAALLPIIFSGITATVATTGGSVAIGSRIYDSKQKRKKRELARKYHKYLAEFDVISYSIEQNHNNVFIPLLLILNREHQELRRMYLDFNGLFGSENYLEQFNKCDFGPYGVGPTKHPIYPKQNLQKRPLGVRTKVLPKLFIGSEVMTTLLYPAEGCSLWLTPNLYITVTNTQFNFHFNSAGRADYLVLKAIIDFLGDRTLDQDRRAERYQKYVNGSLPGDRPDAGLPAPNPIETTIPIIPRRDLSTKALVKSGSNQWEQWFQQKAVEWYLWLKKLCDMTCS